MSSLLTSHDYLPSELLLIIFNNVGNKELYQLTYVSRQFNRLTLIVYFGRQNIKISTEGRIDLPNAIDTRIMLPFIRKAPFVKSIGTLSCVLLSHHSSFLGNIAQLVGILKNVDSVEDFVVIFRAPNGNGAGRVGSGGSSAGQQQIFNKQWARQADDLLVALHELFTAAAGVSHSITIRNGTYLKDLLQKAILKNNKSNQPTGKSKKLSLQTVTSLFSSEKKRILKASQSQTTSTSTTQTRPRPQSSLSLSTIPSRLSYSTKGQVQSFDITSILPLSTPFIDWTLTTLNSNSITQLTFGTIEYQEIDWNHLLSQLHIPTLTTLIWRRYTPFKALIEFLNRHPSVNTLTMTNVDVTGVNVGSGNGSIDDIPLPTTSKAFENIVTLRCCPEGLVVLFDSASTSTSTSGKPSRSQKPFKNLKNISILWGVAKGQQLRMPVISYILSPVIHQLQEFKNLELVIAYRAEEGPAWRTPCRLSAAQLNNTDLPTTGTSTDEQQPEPIFNNITKLTLELSQDAEKSGLPELLNSLSTSLLKIKQFNVDSAKVRFGGRYPEDRIPKVFLVYNVLKRFNRKLEEGSLGLSFFVDGVDVVDEFSSRLTSSNA